MSTPHASRPFSRVRTRPALLRLEDRTVPTTFTVTNPLDAGPGSLRQAVLDANAAAGADSVEFSGLFNNPQTIVLKSGLFVTDALSVTGPGPGLLTVSGNNTTYIAQLASPAGSSVSFSGITFTAGRMAFGYGGAIAANHQRVTLTNCVFSKNSQTLPDYGGGAVAVSGDGSLTAVDCAFLNNTAAGFAGAILVGPGYVNSLTLIRCQLTGNTAVQGGALVASGAVLIDGSTITNNTATGGSVPGYAGGVAVGSNFGEPVTIRNSTVADNKAKAGGGGISLGNGTVALENSTVTGNSAGADGGGIGVGGFNSKLLVRSCTITANQAGANGGGIANFSFGGSTITAESSIAAGNSSAVAGPDLFLPSLTAKSCALGSLAGVATFTDLGGNLPIGVDLKLQPLADNGGPTPTRLPGVGSPLIDAGFNAAPSGTDQRGPTFSRKVGPGTDVGAVEFGSAPGTPTGSLINFELTQAGGTAQSFKVLWADDTAIDVASIDSNDLRVAGPGGYDQLAKLLSTNVIAPGRVEAIYSISANTTGNAGQWDAVDNGTYVVRAEAGEVTDGANAVVADAVGAMFVNIPFPAATATAPVIRTPQLGTTTNTITVEYRHQLPIAYATLDNFDVRVTGPNGYDQPATFKSATPAADATVITATYEVPAAGGTWDAADVGTFTILMEAKQVTDAAGIAVPAGPVGSFDVVLPATVVVNAINDEVTDTDGKMSLREAIHFTNYFLTNTVDTITFDAAVFQAAEVITLTVGLELPVEESLFITGPAGGVTIDAGGKSRVLHVWAGSAHALSLSGLTLKGGAAAQDGGGILIANAALIASRCEFTGNVAGYWGGGISSGNSVTLIDCTVAGNTAPRGGGIFAGAKLNLDNCTISGNLATGSQGGGGIRRGYTTVIRNSTISGNAAIAGPGGGITLDTYSPQVTIQNCTITNNSAATQGGGIFRAGGTRPLTLESTIVAGNTAASGGDDVSGSANISFSLLGVIDGATISGANNLVGTKVSPLNPVLGPLANNGGPTRTHMLLAGSPAIDQGANPQGLSTDQRGPGFQRVVNGSADIGAVERQAGPPIVTLVQVNDGAGQRSVVTKLAVTFSEGVAFPSGLAAAFQLSRTGPGGLTGAVNLSLVQTGNVVTATFVPGGAVGVDPGGSLADGNYTLTVVSSKVQGAFGLLDGNGDGTAGDDYVQAGGPASPSKLFRLFGDADGNGSVEAADFAGFRTAFGGPASLAFDFDGDGDVDAVDFGQFRRRFGTGV